MSTEIKMDPGASTESSLLNNHAHAGYSNGTGHSSPSGLGGQSPPIAQAHSALSHGYGQAPTSQNEAHIDPELRSAHEAGASPIYPPPPTMMPGAITQTPDQSTVMSGPSAASAVAYPNPGADTPDGRKQKRELSNSKRAAQNRAAQRAFRQRKEGYIKKLEQQVKEADDVKASYQALQAENENLRIYVIDLQSRLIDVQGNYPPPPPNINLAHPRAVAMPSAGQAPVQASSTAGSSLEAVAQAVAGMTRDSRDNRADGAREADEISRQLQGEGSDGIPAASM